MSLFFVFQIYYIGETKSTQIELNVQFSPSVISLTKGTLKTGRGLVGELTCITNGEPEPKVTWYKGNEVVQIDARVTSENAGSRHILLLKRIRSSDIGIYMCYIINDFGSSQKTVELTTVDIIEEANDLEVNYGYLIIKSLKVIRN